MPPNRWLATLLDAMRRNPSDPPGPGGVPLLGSLLDLQKNNLGTLCRAAKTYGDCVQLRVGPLKVILITRPEYVKQVLLENSANYTKKSFAYRQLRVFFGNGLIFHEGGESWLRQRRLAQPAFHLERVKGFVATFTTSANALIDRWKGRPDTSAAINMLPEMMKIALQIVGQTLLSRNLIEEADEVDRALSVLLKECDSRTRDVMSWARLDPHRWVRARRARRKLDRLIYSLIAERKKSGVATGDLLGIYLEAVDQDSGKKMTDREIRDEVMSVFIAGHETTANALTWFWFLLSLNPRVEEKVRSEIDSVLDGRSPGFGDLSNLVYTEAAFLETLRLYPPVWLIARQTAEADRFGPYVIPKNVTVFISPYITQRDPTLWAHPDTFDPDRFTQQDPSRCSRFDYFPFAGGPRACIGQRFAMMEAITVIVRIIQTFQLHRVSPDHVELDSSITLRPRQPILFNITRRAPAV